MLSYDKTKTNTIGVYSYKEHKSINVIWQIPKR